MDSATALVTSSSAAWMRRAFEPQPSCTSEPLVRRRRECRVPRRRRRWRRWRGRCARLRPVAQLGGHGVGVERGVGQGGRHQFLSASSMARRPTASSVYSDDHLVGAFFHGGMVRLKVTGNRPAPAATGRRFPARRPATGLARALGERRCAGKRARRRSQNRAATDGRALPASHCTMASTAVLRVQRLGPQGADTNDLPWCSFGKRQMALSLIWQARAAILYRLFWRRAVQRFSAGIRTEGLLMPAAIRSGAMSSAQAVAMAASRLAVSGAVPLANNRRSTGPARALCCRAPAPPGHRAGTRRAYFLVAVCSNGGVAGVQRVQQHFAIAQARQLGHARHRH